MVPFLTIFSDLKANKIHQLHQNPTSPKVPIPRYSSSWTSNSFSGVLLWLIPTTYQKLSGKSWLWNEGPYLLSNSTEYQFSGNQPLLLNTRPGSSINNRTRIYPFMIINVGEQNGKSRHQHFIVVTDTFRLQHPGCYIRYQHWCYLITELTRLCYDFAITNPLDRFKWSVGIILSKRNKAE